MFTLPLVYCVIQVKDNCSSFPAYTPIATFEYTIYHHSGAQSGILLQCLANGFTVRVLFHISFRYQGALVNGTLRCNTTQRLIISFSEWWNYILTSEDHIDIFTRGYVSFVGKCNYYLYSLSFNRTKQNRIYFNKFVQGTSFEIQSIHA